MELLTGDEDKSKSSSLPSFFVPLIASIAIVVGLALVISAILYWRRWKEKREEDKVFNGIEMNKN